MNKCIRFHAIGLPFFRKKAFDKEDQIHLGFGRIGTIYPYTQQNIYTRTLEEKDIETVELENDYLKAIFIPSLGGKLWSLYDKVNQKELLYVNDVIRPSNLAVRNAWVSGGVEWNIGVIGHYPFAYAKCGGIGEAEELLTKEGYLEVEDIREGGVLYFAAMGALQENKEVKEAIPFALDFRML